MSLVARLQAFPETIAEMERAADVRFASGKFLIENAFLDDGIYLLGYTAEILLKTAYCRIDPTASDSLIVDSRIAPAKRYWKSLFGQIPSGHNILFLALPLKDDRVKQGRQAWSAAITARFATCVNQISENWSVEMRYHKEESTSSEAQEFLEDVQWIRQNYNVLWS